MNQHPKITLDWALKGLEAAIGNLREGDAEGRVRKQFHQVLLAVDRDIAAVEIQRIHALRRDRVARSTAC
jgi:hypothetical protein